MTPSKTQPANLRAALTSDDWFRCCPDALQTALLRLSRLQALAHGESLFARGNEAEGLHCVLAGALHIGAQSVDGQSAVLACLEPYQWFGEIALIDDQPRTHDAVASGPTRVLVVPRNDLLAWLAEHPLMWRELGRLACRKLRLTFTALEELSQLPLEQRVWRRLQMVAHGYGSRDTPRRRLALAQETLAQMLGVSRQSINKALNSLQAQGRLTLSYGVIELHNAQDAAAPPGREVGAGRAGPVPH